MRGPLRRCLLLGVAACAAAALLAGGASAKPRQARMPETEITINRWDGETLGKTAYNAKAKGTITHCASDLGLTLHVHGAVKHTVDGRTIIVQFLLNGRLRDSFREHWKGTGSGSFGDGIINREGLPDGRWAIKVIQGSHIIGTSWVILASDPNC